MSPPSLDTSNFPSSLREALGSQVPLHPRERRDLVRRVADNLLNLYSRPKREEIRSTAAQIVAAYPLSLQDRKLDGGLLGRGYDSFFQQLENRIENLNRGKRSASPTAGVSGSKVRKWAYGCANWQPVRRFEPPNDTQEKIQFMKQEGRKNYKEINMTLATQYMQDTYIEQRTFINTDPCPHTSKVKEEWPLLFITPCFYKHADQLLGKDVKATFRERMLECAPQLMHLMELTPRKDTMHMVVHVQDHKNENEEAVQVAVLPLLCAHFKDDEKCLFQVFEEGTSLVGELGQLPSTPTIVVLGRFQCRY
nr:uncharacterized protein LOC129380899 [Dermacentor andersoni]